MDAETPPRLLSVKMAPADYARLEGRAARYGVTISDLVRARLNADDWPEPTDSPRDYDPDLDAE